MNFQRELALVNFPLLIVAGTDIVSVVRCICSLLWNGSGLRALFLFRRFEYCKYLEKLSFVLWITRNRSVFPPRFISLLLCGNVKQEFFGVAPFVCLKLLATSYKSFPRKKKIEKHLCINRERNKRIRPQYSSTINLRSSTMFHLIFIWKKIEKK